MSKNITFVTHLRYDHEDRVKNLQTVLNYYSTNFPESQFIFVEDDVTHNTEFDKIKWPKGRTSFFIIKNNSYYYRTRALNFGIKKAKTPIVVSLDTDCIVPVSSFNKCVSVLLDDVTIAWPYNGFFIDTSHNLHTEFVKKNYDYNFLFGLLPDVTKLQLGHQYGDFSVRCTNTIYEGVGGIVMFNRDRFLEIGGYNENFICWGAEDNELFHRCNIFEHKKYRDTDLNSICFHLFHRNAVRNQHPFYQSNFDEANKVEKMSKKELSNYVKSWKHLSNE
jgi:predicted glycosyltransferase involved in capsule biosynthesis